MVKINFERFPVWADLEHKTQVIRDIKKSIANELYQHGQGIAFHALALKIYNSQGEEEYDEEEYKLILAFAEQLATPAVLDTIRDLGKQIQEAKENK